MVLRVVPGAPTTVDHVVITGLESTRDVVVRRELAVKEESPGPDARSSPSGAWARSGSSIA